MALKGEVGGHALKSHGNYIIDHGKSWENHGIVLLNFCGNPGFISHEVYLIFDQDEEDDEEKEAARENVKKKLKKEPEEKPKKVPVKIETEDTKPSSRK